MDIEATLQALREKTAALRIWDESDPLYADAAREVGDLFEALDEWLCRGGVMPRMWKP